VLLYESGLAADNQMAWYDRGGKLLGTVAAPGPVLDPAISPDGKAIAFRRRSASGSDLWLWDLSRGAEQRFTTDASFKDAPVWSPNGDRIVFSSSRGGGIFNLYQKASTGTGEDELLYANGSVKAPMQWSKDGQYIVYFEGDPRTKSDIGVLRMDSVTNRANPGDSHVAGSRERPSSRIISLCAAQLSVFAGRASSDQDLSVRQ
jgi:serine/threonine-protein kinase